MRNSSVEQPDQGDGLQPRLILFVRLEKTMSRQPSPARIVQYDRLHHFCSALLEYLKSKDTQFSTWGPPRDFWRAGHPFSDSFSGLKQAVGDLLEMTRDIILQETQEADAYLSERRAPTLTQMRREIWQLIPKILRRGKVRNDEEYYLLKERAISLDDPDMDDETRKVADRLLFEYEFRTNKEPNKPLKKDAAKSRRAP